MISEALSRASVKPEEVSEVIMGQVGVLFRLSPEKVIPPKIVESKVWLKASAVFLGKCSTPLRFGWVRLVV